MFKKLFMVAAFYLIVPYTWGDGKTVVNFGIGPTTLLASIEALNKGLNVVIVDTEVHSNQAEFYN